MAKIRKTYIVDDDMDRKIEVLAAVERKSKSEVIDEAFHTLIAAKEESIRTFVNSLTPEDTNARAAGAPNRS